MDINYKYITVYDNTIKKIKSIFLIVKITDR